MPCRGRSVDPLPQSPWYLDGGAVPYLRGGADVHQLQRVAGAPRGSRELRLPLLRPLNPDAERMPDLRVTDDPRPRDGDRATGTRGARAVSDAATHPDGSRHHALA